MGDRHDTLVRQLRVLMDLSMLVNSSLDAEEIKLRSIEAAARLVDAERASLLLIDRATGALGFEVALGDEEEALEQVRLSPGQGIAGWVVEHREGVIVEDARNDPRFYDAIDELCGYVTVNMAAVPVCSHDRLIGVLEAVNKRDADFGPADLDLLESLANHVAIAIENATLYEELKDAFYDMAEVLADTIEKRDRYTGGHTRRVMQYALATGHAMGLAEDSLDNLRLAAILHDIGKIGVPDALLLKPGRLEPSEYRTMMGHAELSAEILGHVRRLRPVLPAVRGHHERIDGSGYPDGLAGDEIPLQARIIAVADAFDAMTSDRPHRRACPLAEAVEELHRCSGSQFDPAVVDAFLSAMSARLE